MKLHPKVAAAGGAGAVGALVAWIVGQYGVPIPPEAAAAVSTLVTFAAGYLKSLGVDIKGVHPKVQAGALASAVMALVVWIVGQYGVPVPPEVAVAGATIITTVVGALWPGQARDAHGRFVKS